MLTLHPASPPFNTSGLKQADWGRQPAKADCPAPEPSPTTYPHDLAQASFFSTVVSGNKEHDNQRIVNTENVQSLESACPREAS